MKKTSKSSVAAALSALRKATPEKQRGKLVNYIAAKHKRSKATARKYMRSIEAHTASTKVQYLVAECLEEAGLKKPSTAVVRHKATTAAQNNTKEAMALLNLLRNERTQMVKARKELQASVSQVMEGAIVRSDVKHADRFNTVEEALKEVEMYHNTRISRLEDLPKQLQELKEHVEELAIWHKLDLSFYAKNKADVTRLVSKNLYSIISSYALNIGPNKDLNRARLDAWASDAKTYISPMSPVSNLADISNPDTLRALFAHFLSTSGLPAHYEGITKRLLDGFNTTMENFSKKTPQGGNTPDQENTDG